MLLKNAYLRMFTLAVTVVGLFMMTACGSDKHLIDSKVLVTDVEAAAAGMEEVANPYHFLNVPTQVNKVGDTYFIVDCYDNQVIYSDDVKAPLYEWKVMTSDMSMGHTIASDGVIYLVDDTENNRVLAFEKSGNIFVETQVLENIGNRPHYIVYNEKNESFYAWSSLTGQMYVIKRDRNTNQIFVSDILEIPELNGVYVRSFTIIDDHVYFVSGNCQIIGAKLKNFEIDERYLVPASMAGMAQLTPVDDGYIITISTDANMDQNYATMIYVSKLENLINEEYTDIYSNFVGGGTPYYITNIDGTYYLTEHRVPGHSVWSFEYKDGQIQNVEAIF